MLLDGGRLLFGLGERGAWVGVEVTFGRVAIVTFVAVVVYVALSVRAAFRRAAGRVLVYGNRLSPGFLKIKFALSAMGAPFVLVPEESTSSIFSLHTHSRGLSLRNGRGVSVPRDYDPVLDGEGRDALPEMPYCMLDDLGMHDTSRILPWIASERPDLCLRGPLVGSRGTKVGFVVVSLFCASLRRASRRAWSSSDPARLRPWLARSSP